MFAQLFVMTTFVLLCECHVTRSQTVDRDKIEQHQLCLLDGVVGNNLPNILVEQIPSIVRPKQLVNFVNKNDTTPIDDTAPICQDANQHQSDHNADTDQGPGVALDTKCLESVIFLSQHGTGLHGFSDSEFAISEALVKKAMESKAFVSESHAKFHREHNDIVTKRDSELGLLPQDDLENMHCCHRLCGRYCKSDIRHAGLLHRAIDMVKSIGRIMAKRRDVRNGNFWFLSPSCKLPVLLIRTSHGMHARLVCRVSLNPLDLDLLHCFVKEDCHGYNLTLQFQRPPASTNLVPIIDCMSEFAIWFTQMWDESCDACKCQLVMDYDLDDTRDYVIRILKRHVACTAGEIGSSSFQSILDGDPCGDQQITPKSQDDMAIDSASSILSRLNSSKKQRTNPKSKDATLQTNKPSFLPPKPNSKKRSPVARVFLCCFSLVVFDCGLS